MTIRHLSLAAGAALVLGATVYLFVQVRATPASAQAPAAVAQRAPAPAIDEETDPPSGQVHIPQPPPRAPDAPAAPAPPPEMPGKPSLGDLVRGAPANQTVTGSFTDPKVMAVMDEANKAYDHGDFDDARAIAQRVLAQSPGNPRMLRIVVSSACISGDAAEAQKAYLQLAPPDREQMKVRCARYGMTFKDE